MASAKHHEASLFIGLGNMGRLMAMTPYMAQGAAMALEDAAVLSRVLAEVNDRSGVAAAFRRSEDTRKARTSRVQLTSRTKTCLKDRTEVDWVYSYNAWAAPLPLAGTRLRIAEERRISRSMGLPADATPSTDAYTQFKRTDNGVC